MEIGALIKEQYSVIEHIGRGGMADVWSARDLRLRRIVAIKTIAKGLAADVNPVKLFETEAQTIAQMEHPHILPIYDFGEYEGSLYIVMRFVTGGSLEDLLRRNGRMAPTVALKMGEAIASALDYAHQNNIIHLDLKPPNILMGSGQTPYLADFGLATVLDMEGRARNPGSGTLLYMAPEQLVAEVIDHRADIYSFSIMMFHMLTGQLPFEGTLPLALAQLQGTNGELPALSSVVPDLPDALAELLRRGTAQNPAQRPNSLSEIIEAMRVIIQPGTVTMEAISVRTTDEIVAAQISPYTQQLIDEGDSNLLEAVDMYTRARHQWAGGQGRFLLGVSHFMLISGYYQDADHYGLTVDETGHEMLLRGALEYDVDVAHWWSKLNDEGRREVCLHTLRSMNTPARIRALYRLETLTDDPTSAQIPRLVSQALEIERDATARIAALRVLNTRAKLIKPRQQYKVVTEYQGRLLTSMTRLGIQIAPPTVWQESVYTPEIDLLIAETALDTDVPEVAEAAARSIGQMRSLTAVRFIATEQRTGRAGALPALAFIRDESPGLPDVVSRQGRWYAWLTNTVRRLTERPMDAILRFVLALLGGWIGMGELVYTTFRSQALFTPQRWGNAIAIGLVFGLFMGLTVLLADEFSRRLERFWHWWLRLAIWGMLGYILGTVTWGAFTWLYLQYDPQWDVMRVVGFTLAFGLVMSALLRLPGWQAVLFTVGLAFMPVYALFRNFYFPQYFSITPVVPVGLLAGLWLGWQTHRRILANGAAARNTTREMFLIVAASWRGLALMVALAAGWVMVWWLIFAQLYSGMLAAATLTWDGILAMFVINILAGLAVGYLAQARLVLLFAGVALAVFVAFDVSVGWIFYDLPYMPTLAERLLSYVTTGGWHFYTSAYTPFALLELPRPLFYGAPLAPAPNTPLFYLDAGQIRVGMAFTVGVPLLLAIALGANTLELLRGWWRFIGKPRQVLERPGWLTALLIYALVATGMMSILALFSGHVNLLWALGWSLWAAVTFVFALATWRWTLWGARGLLAGGMLLVMGGFLYDGFDIWRALNDGVLPPLLQMSVIPLHPGSVAGGNLLTIITSIVTTAPLLWIGWLVVALLAARAAYQRRRWGYGALGIIGIVAGGALLLASQPVAAAPQLWLPVEVGGFTFVGVYTSPVIALYIQASFVWGVFAVALAVFVRGVQQGHLWGGIGFLVLLFGWFALTLFGGVTGSMAVLAALHLGLFAFALRPVWHVLEAERWPLRRTSGELQPLPDTPTRELPAARTFVRPAAAPLEPITEMQTAPALPIDSELLKTRLGPSDALTSRPAGETAPARPVDLGRLEDMLTEVDVVGRYGAASDANIRQGQETPALNTPPEVLEDIGTQLKPQMQLDTGKRPTEAAAQPAFDPDAPTQLRPFDVERLRANAPTTEVDVPPAETPPPSETPAEGFLPDTATQLRPQIDVAPRPPAPDEHARTISVPQVKIDTGHLKTEPKPPEPPPAPEKPASDTKPKPLFQIKLDASKVKSEPRKPLGTDQPSEPPADDETPTSPPDAN